MFPQLTLPPPTIPLTCLLNLRLGCNDELTHSYFFQGHIGLSLLKSFALHEIKLGKNVDERAIPEGIWLLTIISDDRQ